MSKRFILYTAIILSFILLGCDRNNDKTDFHIKNGSDFFITDSSQLYISADRYRNNEVIANRKLLGDWEKFSIQPLKNNKVLIKTSDDTYIGANRNKNGLLTAGYSENENNIIFEIVTNASGNHLLKDHNNKYVSIDSNRVLRANKENMEEADIFFFNDTNSYYFSLEQSIPLIIGILFFIVSLITFQYKENKQLSLILLLLAGFSVRLFVALLDPYLNLWDEQFHALVAKNMMSNPFKPMLYKTPVLPYSMNWGENHIWLHKQPLFLWQMALSMKIFGVNIFGLRLPSILMSTIVIFFIYRIGKITINTTAGFFAALFFTLSNFSLEIVSGAITTDHNDVAFLFYVCASIWAWIEYENTNSYRKKYFLVLVGLFSGCAMLVKWLTGLLVFSGWGLSVTLSNERRKQWVHYKNILLSFFIAIVIFLPWQLYIFHAFPVISKIEFMLNQQHFHKIIERHGGSFLFHFDVMNELYGIGKYLLFLCIILLYTALKNKTFKIAIFTFILLTYLFFGLAATKMLAFTYCISFLIYLAMGASVEKILTILNSKYLPKKIYSVIFTPIILLALSTINLNIEEIRKTHIVRAISGNPFFQRRSYTTPFIKNLSACP